MPKQIKNSTWNLRIPKNHLYPKAMTTPSTVVVKFQLPDFIHVCNTIFVYFYTRKYLNNPYKAYIFMKILLIQPIIFCQNLITIIHAYSCFYSIGYRPKSMAVIFSKKQFFSLFSGIFMVFHANISMKIF